MRYYLAVVIIVCLSSCESKQVQENPQIIDLYQDTIVKEDTIKKRVYELKYDLYYLEKDSTIFMEYCCYSYFNLILDKDTTESFDIHEIENKANCYEIFYKENNVGGLYTDYNYDEQHRLDKANMIYVFFKNNRKTVPYGLADKKFTFLLK